MRAQLIPVLLVLGACAASSSDPRGAAPAEPSSDASPQAIQANSAASESTDPWSAPDLDQATAVFNGRTGERLSFEQLCDVLAEADAVFLGESHTDETTHRAQLGIYEGLLARRDGNVVLAMEMFQRDAQHLLDGYLSGELDEAALLEGGSPWGNYWTAYRPLVERARAGGHRVVGSNYPQGLAFTVSRGGADALAGLDDEQRQSVPRELHPNTDAYHRRVDNAVRGHLGMMGPREPGDQRLYTTQTLWDNAMGEACVDALDSAPGASVLHVNGGFHSLYWDGTVRQVMLRRPQAKVVTVALVPTSNPSVASVSEVPVADYVVFCEQRASDVESGRYKVHVPREVKYRLHLPDAAKGGEPVPLVIWLSDNGLTAQDGIDLCLARLGEDVAVLSFEAPFPETQEDLGIGGRWFWNDSFAEDVFTMLASVERAWGYVLRHYSIDPTRVCLAGEGAGATVVSVVALMTDRMELSAIAFGPRHYAKIKDLPLPLPEQRGGPGLSKHLRVVAGEADMDWWTTELAEYTSIGFDNELVATPQDPWAVELAAENVLRAALGLEARAQPAGGKLHVRLDGSSPRARQWARMWAARVAAEQEAPVAVLESEPLTDESSPVSVAFAPDDEATVAALPLCPGPFGGTTVLVLPAGTPPDQVAAWVALEQDDPITARSKYRRLRIAGPFEGLELPAVLAKLETKNRMNILICPLEFCADGASMRALRDQVEAFADRMTLQWLPGLGGGL